MRKYLFILIYTGLLVVGTISKSNAQVTCTCECLKPVFDYLVESNKLFTYTANNKILISTLMSDAAAAGYTIPIGGCDILTNNKTAYFYALTTATTGTEFKAQFGNCSVVLKSISTKAVNFQNLMGFGCDATGKVSFVNGPAPVVKKFAISRSVISSKVTSASVLFPKVTTFPSYVVDSTSESLRIAFSTTYGKTGGFKITSVLGLDSAIAIPDGVTVIRAKLHLFAYPGGFFPPYYPNAHLPTTSCPGSSSTPAYRPKPNWTYSGTTASSLNNGGVYGDDQPIYTTSPNEDVVLNIQDFFTWGDNRVLDYGFGLIASSAKTNNWPGDTVTQYQTFCSERYPDAAKRPYLEIAWSSHAFDTAVVARLSIDSCLVCDNSEAGLCYSAITDTSVNPYLYGLKGNWRPVRSFVYYNDRNETDPLSQTNIRINGTIKDFNSYWQLKNGVWEPQDTAVSRWVWNRESSLFNEKGAEMENRDPLGRYNAGLYGYGNSLATAIAQNARYREIGYDGFEDYNFSYTNCITCKPARNFDFSGYQSNFVTTEQHSGYYSLRVDTGKTAGISATVTADNNTFNISVNAAANSCGPDSVLKSIRADKNALLPSFSPMAGKKVVVSAWVKEGGQCDSITYKGSQISVIISQSGKADYSVVGRPAGNIIEGWQRIELVAEVPANATQFTISMQNTGTNAVYFDDLRVHPYNANMKSYVYDETSLRMMAELDENNYATFYEYDDDGSLVRLKKETERGVMTIRETRNALLTK